MNGFIDSRIAWGLLLAAGAGTLFVLRRRKAGAHG